MITLGVIAGNNPQFSLSVVTAWSICSCTVSRAFFIACRQFFALAQLLKLCKYFMILLVQLCKIVKLIFRYLKMKKYLNLLFFFLNL